VKVATSEIRHGADVEQRKLKWNKILKAPLEEHELSSNRPGPQIHGLNKRKWSTNGKAGWKVVMYLKIGGLSSKMGRGRMVSSESLHTLGAEIFIAPG
jgi:hypothetical protein